jgi:signal peptidase I
MYFEKILDEDILIKIDLDNIMLKPFPEELIKNAYISTIVGRYSKDFEISERYCFNNECPFDTSLIITNKNKKFYKKYYDLCFDNNVLNSPEWLSIRKVEGEYWLEEYVVDYMYKNKLADIIPIQNYQCGYGYPDMASFVKNKLTGGLYMTHNHI